MAATKLEKTFSSILAGALLLGPSAPPLVGMPVQEPAQPPVFGTQAAAVVVDLVARDKKGRLVRDLTESDFELFEDGVKQTLASFRVVDNALAGEHEGTREAEAAPGPGAPAGAPTPSPAPAKAGGAPSVIALVFDRMTPTARTVAQKAALTYTNRGYVAGDLVAVFSIDLALRTLQPFTNNVDAVRGALQHAAAQGNTAFASDREEARNRSESAIRADEALGGLGAGGGAGAGASQTQAALIASQQAFDQLQINMLHTFDALERDQQGFATTNGLLAVVNGLKPIPGRKTVVFFSEGLAIPSNVQARFRDVIASANRANVSVYAIDAGGLRTESDNKEARDEIVQAARRRAAQEATGRDARGSALTRTLERNEDLLRFNPASGLGQLAEETGGFLVHDTNDVSKGFGRIQEDMRFHYLLSYSPTNESYDGRFRTIAVKVKRPGVELQTRKGYFAVRPEFAVPVRAYEAPALAQFGKTPRPAAFPIHTTALSFPETDRPGLVPVLVEVPGSAVAWAPQPPAGFRADFAVVVRIMDERGREADRLSQQYNLTAPQDKIDAARAGNILFYREANVPPGRYTAEAVAFDAVAQTASVQTSTFDVPKTDGALRLSSLVLVNRAEKLTAEEQKEGKNPLYFGEVILYPNMGAPFRKSVMPALGFYFSVYGKNSASARSVTIEVTDGSRVVAKTASELPAPDPGGRIKHAGTVPLKGLAPGGYTLRVSLNDGQSTVSRDAAFTVVE